MTPARHTWPVAFLLLGVGFAAGQGPAADPLLEDRELEPFVRRLAERLDRVRRNELRQEAVLDAFPAPAEGTAPRTAAAVWYVRAVVLTMFERPQDAREALEKAIRACPRFPRAHFLLANIEMSRGAKTSARKRFLKVVSLQPDCEPALLALGDLSRESGQLEEALSWCRQAVRHHPDSVPAIERCALIRVSLKRLRAALADAGRIRDLEGDASVRFYSLVGQIYLANGELVAACQALEKGVEVCDEAARPKFLRQLLGWYRLAANGERVRSTLDRLLSVKGLPETERLKLEEMRKEITNLDEAVFLLWNYRWQVRAVRDPRVPGADRATAVRFLCHLRKSDLSKHLDADTRKQIEALWWSALDGVTRSRDEEPLVIACRFLEAHPDASSIPLLARLVHPSDVPSGARRAAAAALGAQRRPALLPLLLQCVDDPDDGTAAVADAALRQLVGIAVPTGDPRAVWRRWRRSPAGQEKLRTILDPFGSGSLWELAKDLRDRMQRQLATPALARAVMPILRDPKTDPELFINAYVFLERNVDGGNWRDGKQEIDPILDEEVPALAAAVERWYAQGAAAFTWQGRP